MPEPSAIILKTEPSEYDFARLVRDGRAVWDGITNNAALAFLRAARKGMPAFIYHTGDVRAIVGEAKFATDPYEDPSKPGLNAKGLAKFAVVDLTPVRAAKSPLTLEAMKADGRFDVAGFELFRQGRLSVVPVPGKIEGLIRKLAGL